MLAKLDIVIGMISYAHIDRMNASRKSAIQRGNREKFDSVNGYDADLIHHSEVFVWSQTADTARRSGRRNPALFFLWRSAEGFVGLYR